MEFIWAFLCSHQTRRVWEHTTVAHLALSTLQLARSAVALGTSHLLITTTSGLQLVVPPAHLTISVVEVRPVVLASTLATHHCSKKLVVVY